MFFPVLLLSFIIVFLAGCKKEEIVVYGSLDKLNWSERNYQVINQLITDYGEHGKYFSHDNNPYVVLDWDQTCAYLDVEEALFHYQLTNLKFKISLEQFNEILLDSINGVTQLSEDYQNVVLADINLDLKSEFLFLVENFSGLNGTMTLEEIQMTPQYQDFIVKVPFLYNGYCSTPGIGPEYGYLWVVYLLAGHTVVEVSTLAKEAISYELGNQLGKQTWQSPDNFQTHAGQLSHSFKTGLRVLPEMQNLISTFMKNGIEVYIVSASYKPAVEAFSGIGNFGYNVPADHVIALELETDNEGKILPLYKEGWVKTVRQGKVDAINLVIKSQPGKNHDPLFAAGDSDGDYEMLSAFPDMKLSLIWNRVKGGDIGTLCQQAVDEMNIDHPRYILQGRNENIGMAIPFSESILFGKTEPQLLYP